MVKRWLSLLLIGLLLLSGCAKADPPAPQPLYDAAPSLSQEKITIGGKTLSGVYTADDGNYLNLKDFSDAMGGSLTIEEGIENHTATFSLNGYNHTYTSGEGGSGIYTGEDWYQPKEGLLALLEGYHAFIDAEKFHTYYTAYPLAEEIPEGKRIPTLMYHAVADECWSSITELFVKPAELEKQLQWLQQEGYTTIHFEDLGRVDEIEKPVLLTFDDGYMDNYTELFPLLKKYNAKATVFMIMEFVGSWAYLTAEQIKEMDASGLVSFQSHTMSHEFLSTRSAEQLEYELHQSKIELARLIGKESFVLCYPTGKYSERSLAATKEHYQFGLLMSGPAYRTGADPLRISRYYISRTTDLESYKTMIR